MSAARKKIRGKRVPDRPRHSATDGAKKSSRDFVKALAKGLERLET